MLTRENQLLSIGQVVERLKEIDPDLTVSQLHFYERQGLLQPYRTQGGHRLYCPRTIQRLRLILLLRKKAHLPLKTVASLLKTFEDDPASLMLLMEWLQTPLIQEDPTLSLSEEEAQEKSGLPPAVFRSVVAMGLVQPCPKTGKFDGEALVTLQAIHDLLQMGMTLNDLLPYRTHIDALLQHEEYLFRKVFSQSRSEHPETLYLKFRESLSRFRRFLFLNHLRRVIEKVLPNLETNTKNPFKNKEVER